MNPVLLLPLLHVAFLWWFDQEGLGLSLVVSAIMLPQPSPTHLACIARYCSREREPFHAAHLTLYVRRKALRSHETLGNHLTPMLARLDRIDEARIIFEGLSSRRECSLYCMIHGYIRCGEPREALRFYERNPECVSGVSARVFIALMKACIKIKDVKEGCRIHKEVMKDDILMRDLFIGSTLVDMYAKCGSLGKAQEVFDELPARNAVTWNALISGYANEGHGKYALQCFEEMVLQGIHPNAITFICALKACGSSGAIAQGKEIHYEIIRRGMLNEEVELGSALVDMYAKCGFLTTALDVFEDLPARSVVTWNALIAGYSKCMHDEEAISCYDCMRLEGILPDCFTFSCILKSCGDLRDLGKGCEIHAEISRKSYVHKDIVLSSTLMDMYAKCGLLCIAKEEVFDKLDIRDVVSWTTLIVGYVEEELFEEALDCFDQMQLEGLPPDSTAFSCSLKACGCIGAIEKGQSLHLAVERSGLLQNDVQLCFTLIEMYVKCGLLAKANEVLDELPHRDAILWNSVIAGYASVDCSEEALEIYERMQLEHVIPDALTYVHALKACGVIGSFEKGAEIHAKAERGGFLVHDALVGNALIDMYSECGLLDQAQRVFDNLPQRGITSWNSLIAGYSKHEYAEEAIVCFQMMLAQNVSPDEITFTFILKACQIVQSMTMGTLVHSEMLRRGLLEDEVVLGGSLIDTYTECGLLERAQEVFDHLRLQNTASWNALIAGYAKNGYGETVLNCFEQMKLFGTTADHTTFVCVVTVCGITGDVDKGRAVHGEIEKIARLKNFSDVGTALADMYARCGLLRDAQQVLDSFPVSEAALWNALIWIFILYGFGEAALELFQQMLLQNVCPDVTTFVYSLKACSSTTAKRRGREIHAVVHITGRIAEDIAIGNSLVDMYAKCGLLAKAREVFEDLSGRRNTITWNALISGYAKHGCDEETLKCFREMESQGFSPDSVTYACILKACGSIGGVTVGESMHAEIERRGLWERDALVGNGLVDMYAKIGRLSTAQRLFERLPSRDVVSWNALIAGYVRHGRAEEALRCYEQMQIDGGVSANARTHVCGLRACGMIASLENGSKMHRAIESAGGGAAALLPGADLAVANSLIDMYARCGDLAKAQQVFDALDAPDSVSWNALIAGYAQTDNDSAAFRMMERMEQTGTMPDSTTFRSALVACNHGGFVGRAEQCLILMTQGHSRVGLGLEHCTCMIELLGRAGQMNRAAEAVARLPFHPDAAMLSTLLGACRQWGNVELGTLAFEQAVRLDRSETAPYMYMYNLCRDSSIRGDMPIPVLC